MMPTNHNPAPLRDAGIVSRVLAAGIDLVVVLVVMAGGYLGLALVLFAISIRDFTFPEVPWIFTATGFIVASVLYLFCCWALTMRTVGYGILGLRLADRRGNRVRAPRVLLRAVFCVVFPVGLMWVLVSSHRRSLPDIVLRTRVIYDR